MDPIFHLTTPDAWDRDRLDGQYCPPSLTREGFIHASTRAQVAGSANRFFADQPNLLVLTIDPDRLDVPLRWEASPHSPSPFPHLYGPLPLDAVVAVDPWLRAHDGRFDPADLAP